MFSFSGPAEVRGALQRLRDRLQPVLVVIFLMMPWLKIKGEPLILFDLFNRHFVLFGFTFYSHDMPLLFFILILVVLTIFLVTALFGRLWCGWACPQTVFLHAVFNKIEVFILGSFTNRNQFFKSQDSFKKRFKILLVYFIFLFICWTLAHSFVAYFLGADVVTSFILEGPSQHLNSFIFLMTMTALLFFNFAFFREKFCFSICPYGRFQNALIDRNSLTVFYDQKRGEQRGKFSKIKPSGQGDCIDCQRCVTVCPTKIDIRHGFQLECIACGKCIDACNEVMHKIERSPGLIRYETVNQKPITLKRFRLGLYTFLILLFASALVLTLMGRAAIDLNISRAHTQPFSFRYQGPDKVLQNQILLHLKSQASEPLQVVLSLSEKDTNHGYRIISPVNGLTLQPGQDLKTFGFIEIDSTQFNSKESEILIQVKTEKSTAERSFQFVEVN